MCDDTMQTYRCSGGQKNPTKPKHPNTNWLILDVFDPNCKKELLKAKWPKTSKKTGKPLMTLHIVWNVEDGVLCLLWNEW